MKPSELLSLQSALATLLAKATPSQAVMQLPLEHGIGCVLAQDVVSTLNVPPLDNSAMDGYAVRVADVMQGHAPSGQALRVSQRIPAGSVGTTLEPGTVARIFTGAPVPPGADAVVMQEHCTVQGDAVVIRQPVVPQQNIRPAGQDIAVGQVVVTAGTVLGADHLGVIASVGLPVIAVHKRLRVGLFSTGNELALPGEPLKPGGIYNSNRYALTGLLQALGVQINDYGVVQDTLAATQATLQQAADQNDLVITSGGVSVGEEDHVKAAVQSLGTLDLWSIAIKPGKPFAYGRLNRSAGSDAQAHFIGLPGNPVSSYVTFLLLALPFLRRCQGAVVSETVLPQAMQVEADFDWRKPDRRREFLRVRLDAQGKAQLFPNQSSGVLTSMAWADGLVDVAPGQVVSKGQSVPFVAFNAFFA